MRLTEYIILSMVAWLMCSCYLTREPKSRDENSRSGATGERDASSPGASKDSPASSSIQTNPYDTDPRFFADSSTVGSENDSGIDETGSATIDASITDSDLIESNCPFTCVVLEDDAGLSNEIFGRVRTGNTDVNGSLRTEVVRRIVRRHIYQIRCCYERALGLNSDLSGSVAVDFTISPAGVVESAAIASSDLEDEGIHSCIISAVDCWTFSMPEDGEAVTVTYRFHLGIVQRP